MMTGKKLLFILLFSSLISFSQEVTLKDLLSINSEDTFKKVVIENGYEFDSENGGILYYGYNIIRDSTEGNTSHKWALYNDKFGFIEFQFVKNDMFVELEFNRIVTDIKSNCEYFEIDGDYVTYNCPDSSFNGQIGFKTSKGAGYVANFPILNFE